MPLPQTFLPLWAEPLSKVLKAFLTHGAGSVRMNYQEGRESKLEVILHISREQAQDIARALNLS